jgi:glycogen debranching enzyme
VRSTILFPKETVVKTETYKDHVYLSALLQDGTLAILWGSGNLKSLEPKLDDEGTVRTIAEFPWPAGADWPEYGLSFTYLPGSSSAQLNSIFDIFDPATPNIESHIGRMHLILEQAERAMERYLQTSQLFTPDEVLNQAVNWAKVNQLKDQQQYKWGHGFSNNPPSDTVVGRDSAWYLSGSVYFAQSWSRKLLDFWFDYGLGSNGKFTEFMTGCSDPILTNDYDLNVNDNTPLFLIAAHQYYSLTGDKDFLNKVFPQLINTANFIIEQREIGEKNRYHLVWCTTTEKFIRGLCGWRNCIRDYNLAGAVTEVNCECYHALKLTAELAREMGDLPNYDRLVQEAEDLYQAIQAHLRSTDPRNPYYYLNIDPSGEPVADMTADLLFPVMYGVSNEKTSQAILEELFSERFWIETTGGGGGIRTVSTAEPGYQPKADSANYGLMGGVWPNLALWTAKAAASHNRPDLALKALRSTFLLTEHDDPASYNVVPGELPEYLNGDDLVQRGQPRSTFLFGIVVSAAIECFLGISLHPDCIKVNPKLPDGWGWVAISNLPYRGFPLSIIADSDDKIIYTTARVDSTWKQIVASPTLQKQFAFESNGNVFWMVVPHEHGYQFIAAAATATEGSLYDKDTGRKIAAVNIPEKGLVRQKIEVF